MEKNPSHQIDRREFLQGTLAAGSALVVGGYGFHVFGDDSAASDKPLLTRVLGRTGREVTILGLGTAPIGEGPVDTQEAAKIFGAVLDQGVTYVDTARGYGNAEEALGYLVPKRRDELFLVTKCWTETAADAEKSLTESLRLLKTDHVDLCHIHHIGGKDVDRVLADDGILRYLEKQREAGKIRYIGMTGHARASNFLRMLETDRIDVVMTIFNYADRNIYEFESKVLPAAREKNVAVVAMKVYAGIKGGFPNHRNGSVGCATDPKYLPQAMAYALDLEGITAAVVGPYTLEQAIQNVEFARQYRPLTDAERSELLAYGVKLAESLGPRYGPVS